MNVIVVISPAASWRRNRGFRHAVVVGEKRALCGRNVDDWQGDVETIDGVPFREARVGCRSCIRAAEARS